MVKRIVLSILISVLLFSIAANVSGGVKVESLARCPKMEDLIIRPYPDVWAAYAALKAGDIDIIGYELTTDLYEEAINDTNIVLAPVGDLDMYEFDLNNNYTIHSYVGIESPLFGEKRVGFRQAIALLTPKDRFVTDCCGGFADRIDLPMSYLHRGWRNQSYWYEDSTYPYEYDPDAAAALLDATGFVQGMTVNPDWDNTLTWSAEYLRTYPSDHPQRPNQDLDPLEVCIRDDDLRRLCAGNILLDNMLKMGIPCNPSYGDLHDMYDKVMVNMNYHIYTGCWNLRSSPALSVHALYHDDYWSQRGYNYVTGKNESNLGNYPILDAYLHNVHSPPDYATAQAELKKALGYGWGELCITIPLWSTRSFWAYSKNLLGVVSMAGVGLENGYTFMKAYKVDRTAIRYAISHPNAMNIIFSSWSYDYQCLNRMNLHGGLDMPPYDLSIFQAGFVQDWDTDTWIDPDDGINKTKVTRRFRNDGYFAEPVTGNKKANVNGSHYFFSAWYIKQVEGWLEPSFRDVHHIDVVNDFRVDIYFNTSSYWNTYQANGPMLPIDVWLKPPLAYNTTETFVEGTNLTTPGMLNLSGAPVWTNLITVDGDPLNMFTDYNIVKGQLGIFADLADGTVVEVDYWYTGDPTGYTPGNLPWYTIFEGAGMYYATSFTSPGSLTLKCNPYYWMETPPLGEIDFLWKWENGPKPRIGCYGIDIYDVVMQAYAYGSQGTGVPDRKWRPGADVAPSGGKVDIFDIVSTSGPYGYTWGGTP